MYSYLPMVRALKEHCEIKEEESAPAELRVKANRKIFSDCLQNPSDPDATYSGHKGQGYQVQMMERFCTDEEEEEREKTLKLITHVQVQRACDELLGPVGIMNIARSMEKVKELPSLCHRAKQGVVLTVSK